MTEFKTVEHNISSQQQLDSFSVLSILRLQRIWPEYIDTEWALYNIALIVVMIYISHIVSVTYRCTREHTRQLNRMYVERKWLDSRINLISRKQAALRAITEQLRQEIYRETFACNIIERCERESIEKLEAKKREDINNAIARVSRLECSNASLRSKLLSIRASISSDELSALSNITSASNPNTVSSNNSIKLKDAVEDKNLSSMIDSSFGIEPLSSVDDMFLGSNGFSPYQDNLSNSEEGSTCDTDSDVHDKDLSESFNIKSVSMLGDSFETDITASMLILQLEDFALKHGACQKQCLISVVRALMDKSGILNLNQELLYDQNNQKLSTLLTRFSKLVSHYIDTESDKEFLKFYIKSMISGSNYVDRTLEVFSIHGFF